MGLRNLHNRITADGAIYYKSKRPLSYGNGLMYISSESSGNQYSSSFHRKSSLEG
ncbi:hypothetical protein HMPREF9135_2195 [Segatella baroniae F0067]|uniref:Uncharacterized protein n=1 Tax=Segatella baroniae F0067 TaxID=1115809 RepID=U2QNP0_9BACT|nr:hypothetical protein HMPREF9135_2195 [Segatella baroniae F0067]